MPPLHKFLKYQAFDHIMFGFITAYRKGFPACSIERAIMLFVSHYEIPGNDVNLQSLKRKFIRMEQDYISYQRHESAAAGENMEVD